jgi:hypothetical protein
VEPFPQVPVHVPELTADDAARLGYSLTRADVRRLLRVRTDEVGEMLASGALPSLRVRSRGGTAYRVRPADLEQMETGARSDEVGVPEMALLVSAEVGFDVSLRAVTRAAREGKITVRVARRGHWFYAPNVVLAEIRAGRWRPHRAPAVTRQPPRERVCANGRCTNGEDGGRARRAVHVSRLDRSRSGWTCSRECRKAVGKARPQKRTVKRACVCDGCDGFVWVTRRRSLDGTGPQRCDGCRAAGRVTPAQRAARSRNLSRLLEGAEFARGHVERGVAAGRRNAHSPKHMDGLISARMTRHAIDKATRAAAIEAALLADPSESNSSLTRRLGCGWAAVASVRADLERAGRIPARGAPQRRPAARYASAAVYTGEIKSRIEGRALSRAQRASARSGAAREQEQRMRELWPSDKTVREIADELETTVDNVKKMRQRLGLTTRPRGRRRSK